MKYWLISILTLTFFSSCTDNDRVLPEENRGAIVDEITVTKGTRANDVTDEDGEIMTANEFSEGSILYISQMGTTANPGFLEGNATEGNFCPLYKYVYSENTNANWYQEYNFKPSDNSPITWDDIKKYGNVGNAFSLYAMYFPGQEVRFDVEADQRKQDDFQKSDIMGAYHATSSLYTRLRFRLFHLMVYLKVTLYVPVYSEHTSNNETEMSFSGFRPGAMQAPYVANAYKSFNIEWRANRSSDTEAPLTQATRENPTKIIMYQHHDVDKDKTICLDVSKYYTGDFIGVCKCQKEGGVPCDDCKCECYKEGGPSACKCDEVHVYNFSVLFPAQSFGDNFLCFPLKAPDDENIIKYYYFSGSQIVGGDNENYSLTQGTLQHLSLYLPRLKNETILVGAKILPWSEAETDMTVTKKDDSQ